ncbi:hypothetical protein SODALDRAFT_218205 [Sodiomyces alkalinus F11]|uniref:Uncharacterized protein n=1 Tax=Sodiomyces alkalinus (strain CBS 110278 / VKM F-3762 / F11) TaxID=1314773 RepID=A0A3N2PPK4_SODAK|nr:hypothetical protein SODALDRAFT_218205 [Sodiomyces alkalinus F11]ROT36370.1 hypothetical protein SODALDRAFT_218205 [Sodiomyces alkalinus F11]
MLVRCISLSLGSPFASFPSFIGLPLHLYFPLHLLFSVQLTGDLIFEEEMYSITLSVCLFSLFTGLHHIPRPPSRFPYQLLF